VAEPAPGYFRWETRCDECGSQWAAWAHEDLDSPLGWTDLADEKSAVLVHETLVRVLLGLAARQCCRDLVCG